MLEIPKISTGQPSTLETYRGIALVMSGFNEENEAVKFFDKRIKEAEDGKNAVVIQDERQMIMLIYHLSQGE